MRKWWIVTPIILLVGIVAPAQSNMRAQLDRLVPQQQIAGRGIVESIAWGPDGDQFVTSGREGVYIYDADTLDDIGFWGGADNYIGHVAWHPAQPKIAGAVASDRRFGERLRYADAAVYVWDLTTDALPMKLQLPTEDLTVELPSNQPMSDTLISITDLVWNPSDSRLAAVGQVQFFTTVTVWDSETGELLDSLVLDAFQGQDFVLRWSADGTLLAVGQFDQAADSVITIWDIEGAPQSLTVEQPLDAMVWREDSLIVTGDAGALQIDPLSLAVSPIDGVYSPRVSPDGTLTFANMGQTITISRTEDGTAMDSFTLEAESRFGPRFDRVEWLASGDLLAMVSLREPQLYVWDIETGGVLGWYQAQTRGFYTSSVTPSADAIIVAEFSGTLERIDLESLAVDMRRRIDNRNVIGMALSPDGTQLAYTQADDDPLVVLDLMDESETFAVSRPDLKWMSAVAWAPDGTQLLATDIAVGSEEIVVNDNRASLLVWDAATGALQMQHFVDGYLGDGFYKLSWRDDGEYLAGLLLSNLTGQTLIYIWDRTGSVVLVVPVVARDFTWLADGNLLVSGPLGVYSDNYDDLSQLQMIDIAASIELGDVVPLQTVALRDGLPDGVRFALRLAINPVDPDLIAIHFGDAIDLYRLSSASVVATIPIEARGIYAPMVWCADGRFLATEQTVRMDDRFRVQLQIWELSGDDQMMLVASSEAHALSRTGIHGIAWDGLARLISIGGYGDIIVWEFRDDQ